MTKFFEQFRAQALEHSLDALIAIDLDDRIIDWNARATQLFGWERAEALGRTLSTLLVPERFRGIYLDELERCRADWRLSPLFERVELTGIRRDGGEFPIEAQVTPVCVEGSRALYASVSDISARVEALRAVREREAHYQQILDSISDLILVKGERSRLVWANRAFREYYGMSNEELVGKLDSPFNEPDFTAQYVKDDAYVFTTGKSLNIPAEPVKRHDGVIRYFHTVKSPIRDETGAVKMTVGVARDITERKETQEKLRQNELLLQSLIDHSPFVVFVKDLEGRHVLVNREYEKVLKLPASGIIGKTDEDLFHHEASRAFVDQDRKVLEQGTALQFEEGLELEGKSYFYFTVKFPLRAPDGRIYAICGISTDITETRRAQSTIAEQRIRMLSAAKMSALGEMAGGIAHEINNPLAVIHLRAGQIRQMVANNQLVRADLMESAQRIESTAMRISKIVKSLRSFARDDVQDPFQQVTLKAIIDDTVDLCSARFLNHKISLAIEPLPPGATLECRPGQVSQVLLNLLNNAHDAVERLEDRWVRVEARDEDDHVFVSVIDSGGGIPAELREKIMQPFFTTKEIGRGTGLGLSISRGIVDSHHGQLGLDPEAENTSFFFRLPKRQLPSSLVCAPPSSVRLRADLA
jgi:PAS domain S-box-containing protein